MDIKDPEALNKRAQNLKNNGLNGIEFVLVSLDPDPVKNKAYLEVHLINNNEIPNLLTGDPKLVFPISGGHRKPAGISAGQVKVTAVSNPENSILTLDVEPIGDYSTYTLSINFEKIDPVFSEINFKFRPGCFNLCAPDWKPVLPPVENPAVDYLAKDYDSFKHTMISAMMERVPGWRATSEADLDQVLLELFSAAADEMSDYQDRVMNEAYLGTARKRVSIARHARLMDYHINQGNQASTWLALKTTDDILLPQKFIVWSGDHKITSSSEIFITHNESPVSSLFNEVPIYTWSNSVRALKAGTTKADLIFENGDENKTKLAADLILNGQIKYLLIQEYLDPVSCKKVTKGSHKRQIVQLLTDQNAASVIKDPLTGNWLLRVRWNEKDRLKENYCLTIESDGITGDISLMHGNLVKVYHGQPVSSVFYEQPDENIDENKNYYERTKWGAVCRLPVGPLSYKYIENNIPGETPPESTLEVNIYTSGSASDKWDEVISLIHSDDSDEQGDHFIVETDEEVIL